MHTDLRSPIPGGALWGMLWRSVVWFPFAVAKLIAILFGIVGALWPFVMTATGTIAFALLGFWWQAAACSIGFLVCAWLASWLIRRGATRAIHAEVFREGDLRG